MKFQKKICLLTPLVLLSLISLNSCFPHGSEPIGEIVYTQYKVPNLNLDFFSDNRKDILIDYLTKSSEWHVFPLNKTIVAVKRFNSKNCNPVIARLPCSTMAGAAHGLGSDFLDLYPDISEIRESSFSQKNMATENSQIRLMMEKPYRFPNSTLPISHALLSDLIIESKNKKLRLYSSDNSDDIHRPATTEFLISISKELEKLAKFSAKGNQLVDESILPTGSILISPQPIMSVEQSRSKYQGYYDIFGYINPGQKGFIYLKVIHNKTGEIIRSKKESTNAEYIGWSNNPAQKFNFFIGAELRGSADDARNVPVDFQIWFKPANHSPEKMLIKKTYLVDMSFK